MNTSGEPKRPILVTGSHRSGSTWVGRMLAKAEKTHYIHEPFKPVTYRPGICNIRFPYWFTYISSHNQLAFYDPVRRMVELRYNLMPALRSAGSAYRIGKHLTRSMEYLSYRRRHYIPIIKDPIALFSAPWLAQTFGLRVMVMIRHPAAFVNSILAKNWIFPFQDFLAQPELMQTYLLPFKDELHQFAVEEKDILLQACLLWRIFYDVVRRFQNTYPDWIYIRHEDISRDPVDSYRHLYARCNLDFSDDVHAAIEAHSMVNVESSHVISSRDQHIVRNSAVNIKSWKSELTPEQQHTIRVLVEDVSADFYTEADW